MDASPITSKIIYSIENAPPAKEIEYLVGQNLIVEIDEEIKSIENEINSILFQKGIFVFLEYNDDKEECNQDEKNMVDVSVIFYRCKNNPIEKYDPSTKKTYSDYIQILLNSCIEKKDPNPKNLPSLVGFLCCFAEYQVKKQLESHGIDLFKNKLTGNLECKVL